jgi:hypothetical protein
MNVNTSPKILKAYCALCGGDRNCEVKSEHTSFFDDDMISSRTTWRILDCRGCDNVFCQTNSINSEDVDYDYDETGEGVEIPNETIKYWPAPSRRPRPDWLDEINLVNGHQTLFVALNELYVALDTDLPILSGIAVRLCFETAAEALGVCDHLTFKEKIAELLDKGNLGATAKYRIDTAIQAGHAATHRAWAPAPEDLSTLVDILESFINDSIVEPGRKKDIDKRTDQLSKRVLPDPRKKPKSVQGHDATKIEA